MTIILAKEAAERSRPEPQTNAERTTAFRQRQAEMGRKQRVFYLTDLEHEYLKIVLEMAREELPEWKSDQ